MDGFFQTRGHDLQSFWCLQVEVAFINHLKWELAGLVGGERWALGPSFGADGRQVPEQGTGTVPKPGSAGCQSSWHHPEERTAQEVKCRSPIFELCLWITEFISLWPESEAAAWKSPVLWHSHNPVQVELQVLIYKAKRWGRGGTNTASSKEENIGVSPNLCSVPLGTQSFQEGRAFQRHFGCTRRALEHWNPLICFFQASYLSELVEGSQETSQTTGLGGTGGRWGREEAAGWVWTGCLKCGKHTVFSISWLETPDISKLVLYHF